MKVVKSVSWPQQVTIEVNTPRELEDLEKFVTGKGNIPVTPTPGPKKKRKYTKRKKKPVLPGKVLKPRPRIEPKTQPESQPETRPEDPLDPPGAEEGFQKHRIIQTLEKFGATTCGRIVVETGIQRETVRKYLDELLADKKITERQYSNSVLYGIPKRGAG